MGRRVGTLALRSYKCKVNGNENRKCGTRAGGWGWGVGVGKKILECNKNTACLHFNMTAEQN